MQLNKIHALRNLFLTMSCITLSRDRRLITDGTMTLSAELFGDSVVTDGLFDMHKLGVITGWTLSDMSPRTISMQSDQFPQVYSMGQWEYTGLVAPTPDGDMYLYARGASNTPPGVLQIPRKYIDAVFKHSVPSKLYGANHTVPLTIRRYVEPSRNVLFSILPAPTALPLSTEVGITHAARRIERDV